MIVTAWGRQIDQLSSWWRSMGAAARRRSRGPHPLVPLTPNPLLPKFVLLPRSLYLKAGQPFPPARRPTALLQGCLLCPPSPLVPRQSSTSCRQCGTRRRRTSRQAARWLLAPMLRSCTRAPGPRPLMGARCWSMVHRLAGCRRGLAAATAAAAAASCLLHLFSPAPTHLPSCRPRSIGATSPPSSCLA